MSEENKAVVRRLVAEVQSGHNLDAMEKFYEPNFINHLVHADPSSSLNSVERAKLVFQQLFRAFPDLHVTIEEQVAEGDRVVTHKIFRGTHRGEFMGVAPSGKQIEFAVMDILRLENGKVVEHTAVQDRAALLQQLGLVVSPSAA